MRFVLTVVPALLLTSCASIIEGSTQEITVNSSPPGANCAFMRDGQHVAEISKSPGSAVVKKTGADITVDCTKPGYQEATAIDHSDVAAATFGNIILGGLVGIIIDAVDGSIHKYDPVVSVTLPPAPAQPATATEKPETPAG